MTKKKVILIGSFALGAVCGALLVKLRRSKKCSCCNCDNVDYVCDCTADAVTEAQEGESEDE